MIMLEDATRSQSPRLCTVTGKVRPGILMVETVVEPEVKYSENCGARC